MFRSKRRPGGCVEGGFENPKKCLIPSDPLERVSAQGGCSRSCRNLLGPRLLTNCWGSRWLYWVHLRGHSSNFPGSCISRLSSHLENARGRLIPCGSRKCKNLQGQVRSDFQLSKGKGLTEQSTGNQFEQRDQRSLPIVRRT